MVGDGGVGFDDGVKRQRKTRGTARKRSEKARDTHDVTKIRITAARRLVFPLFRGGSVTMCGVLGGESMETETALWSRASEHTDFKVVHDTKAPRYWLYVPTNASSPPGPIPLAAFINTST